LPSGAVVTGANISLTNTQNQRHQKDRSGTDGEYSFTLIPVGQYRLTVERTGFRKYVQEGIILQVKPGRQAGHSRYRSAPKPKLWK